MPSHIHLLCQAKEDDLLSNIVRDFKSFTSKKIIETIKNENESRREWLLEMFQESCAHLKRNQVFKVWQTGYHAEYIESEKFTFQKLNYIHQNPVVDKIVEHPWEYVFSSAQNYADKEGLVKVICLNRELKTISCKNSRLWGTDETAAPTGCGTLPAGRNYRLTGFIKLHHPLK